MESLTPYIVVWVFCGIIAGVIGANRSLGGGGGFLLGVLFGPFGVLIAAVSGRQSALQRVEARPEAAGWHRDPLGRFDRRYHDGHKWTAHVTRDADQQQFEDPV